MEDALSYYDPRANWSLIPEYMRPGLEAYVMKGVPPGGFMTAVLANDLMEAAGRADASNARALIGWATFLYNYAPSSCKGSYEAVERWINTGGLEGIRRAAEGGEGEGEGSGANRPAKAPAKPEPGMLTQEQIDDIWDDANG